MSTVGLEAERVAGGRQVVRESGRLGPRIGCCVTGNSSGESQPGAPPPPGKGSPLLRPFHPGR